MDTATRSRVNDEPGRSEEANRIRREMEQTRFEMGRTLGELQTRLNPELLKQQAKDAAYDATIGRVGNMVQNNGFVQTIKDNPIPAALAALGIGWLVVRARSAPRAIAVTESEGPSVTEQIGDQTRELKERATDKIRSVAHEAEARSRQVGDNVQRAFTDNPLAIGLGVVAVGLAIGLALPITQKEDEWMGQARDRLLDKAQQAAHGALDKADEASHRGVDQASQQLEPTTQPDGARIQT